MTRHNRSRWQGHGQGHKPAPMARAPLGPWHIIAMIIVYGMGTAGLVALVLCWLRLLAHWLGFAS